MKHRLFFLLVTICTAGMTSAQLPSYVPMDGLVSWWGFAGNADDQSGNGNHGTVNGALPTTDRFNVPDNAYSFDGIDDDILIGVDPDFRLEEFSVSGWLKTNSGDPGYNTLFSYFITTPDGYAGYWLGMRNNRACLYLADSLSGGFDILSADTINDGEWHFILATYDSTHEATLYVDGVQQNAQNYAASIQEATAQIGNDHLSELFEGVLDDIGVWNRVLSDTEILATATGCDVSFISQPANQESPIDSNVHFSAFASGSNVAYQWQTDVGFGFQQIIDIFQYSGADSTTLTIEKVDLSNHLQPFRVIATNENCADTSEVAFLMLTDTCIVTINDTSFVTIMDTTFVTITDTTVVTVMDTIYTEFTDTTFITITDTTYFEIFDTTLITINDTIHFEIFDTTLVVVTDTTFIEFTDTTYTTVTDTLIIDAILSSLPPGTVNTLKVFPNPASTHLTIDNGDFALMNGYHIRIENVSGVSVFSEDIDQQVFEINLSTWTGNGVYFLQLIDPGGFAVDVRKIILQ